MAVGLFFAAAPLHITVRRRQPVQAEGGEFNLTLAPTGPTGLVPTPVTCLPIQGVVIPGHEPDPACLPKDRSHDRTALVGLAVFLAGGVLWWMSGTERSLLRPRSLT